MSAIGESRVSVSCEWFRGLRLMVVVWLVVLCSWCLPLCCEVPGSTWLVDSCVRVPVVHFFLSCLAWHLMALRILVGIFQWYTCVPMVRKCGGEVIVISIFEEFAITSIMIVLIVSTRISSIVGEFARRAERLRGRNYFEYCI